jgi:hypothetical protein
VSRMIDSFKPLSFAPGSAYAADVNEMRSTRDMTVCGVIVASGETIDLAVPIPVRDGDRVHYGVLHDGTPMVFVGTETPLFYETVGSQVNWSADAVGVAALEDGRPTADLQWSVKVIDDDERPRSRSMTGLRLVPDDQGITLETEEPDAHRFISLALTANVINLTVNVIATPEQAANLPADLTEQLVSAARRGA